MSSHKGILRQLLLLLLCHHFVEGVEHSCKHIRDRTDNVNANFNLSKVLADGGREMDAQMSRLGPHATSKGRAIFMLGNTGAGKTTVTQIITGNLQTLHASRYKQGSLVIIDDSERIGAPETTSRTLIPEYVVHPETGDAFWDCPGFEDTRGAEVDIAAMYLLNKALSSTTHAKFLFVANHGSVTTGITRKGFDLLATHAVRLLKNVGKFVDSIGLVVSKVPGYEGPKLLSDDKIMKGIETFLKLYVSTTLKDLKTMTNADLKREAENKVLFAQGLLGLRGKRKERKIYFVRNPIECGPLGGMSSFVHAREKVTDLYQNSLEYSAVEPTDFNYTLQYQTRLTIREKIFPHAMARINAKSSQIVADLRSGIHTQLYQVLQHRMDRKLEFLARAATRMSWFDKNLRSTTTSQGKFIWDLKQLYADLSFPSNDGNIDLWLQLESQLNFFEMMINREATVQVPNADFRSNVAALSKSLTELQTFYEFCGQVEPTLATYSKYVIFEQVVRNKGGSVNFAEEDTLGFLNNNSVVAVPSPIFLLWPNIRAEDKKQLATLVKNMIPQPTEFKCEKSSLDTQKWRLAVSGRSVKMSDVNKQQHWPSSCTQHSVLEISVVAMERVYFDENFLAEGRMLRFSVVAPVWDVVVASGYTRHINLDGIQPPGQRKMMGGYPHYSFGGLAGLQGGSAGAFFGVYSKAINGNRLLISANGGKGGRGGDGADGRDGKAGTDAKYEDFPGAYETDGLRKLDDGYYENDKLISSKVIAVVYNQRYKSMRGKPGESGGHGGGGGNGGAPGNPGKIELICTTQANEGNIRVSAKVGEKGQPGAGGKGGRGGKNGNNLSCLHHTTVIVLIPVVNWGKCYEDVVTTTRPDGDKGRDGQWTPAADVHYTENHQTWRSIQAYRSNFLNKQSSIKDLFLKTLDIKS